MSETIIRQHKIKNPLPIQVKGLYSKETYKKAKNSNFITLHVQPVTRGLKQSFLYNKSGRSPGLKIITSAIFPVSQ